MTKQFRYIQTGSFSSSKEGKYENVLFIGFNPPSLDKAVAGSILGKINRFGIAFRARKYTIVNLFPQVAPSSSCIKGNDPHAVENELENLTYITNEVRDADLIVGAWGRRGTLFGRARTVVNLLTREQKEIYSVGPLTANKQPMHFRYWNTSAPTFSLSRYLTYGAPE